jgi:tRNA (guanine26-N2/guanine27-N2)-dimethyltransferase
MGIKTINEGLVEIKIPEIDKISSKAPVFYNPVMELNRDLSILALKTYGEKIVHKIKICDAFGGSGIRGVRYAKEINNVENVVISDINPLAIQYTQENIKLNHLKNLDVYKEDANILLRKCIGKFDVVDIDPFGTPSPYIESAGISIKSEGMIFVTATDTSSLCGTYKEPCIRKYGAMPLKTEYCHEIGIRILIGFIARTLAKYKKCINVKFAHSSEHYMRVYVTVSKGAKITDESLKKIGYILHCQNCLNRMVIKGIAPKIGQKCPFCGEKFKIIGPLWCDKIEDTNFIKEMLKNMEKTKINQENNALKLLNFVYNESDAPPTFYELHEICSKLKVSAPKILDVINSLKENSYFASRTHFKSTGIKTDAPIDKIEKIILNLI